MRLNSRGDRCAGEGGTAVSYNGTVIATNAGQGADWMDDDHIIYQVCQGVPEACRVEQYNVRTDKKDTLFHHGAFDISGGGGLGAIRGDGVTLTDGRHFPGAGLGPVGPDGAVAIKNSFQSAGPWTVHERDGSSWRLTDNDAIQINLLGQGRAVWLDTAGFRSRNMPTPVMLPGIVHWMRAVDVAGEWWVLYQDQIERLVFHPFTSTIGYEIAPANSRTFGPDVVVLHGTTVRIVWATRQDEGPDVQQVRDLNLAEARQELRMPPVTDPPPPPPPEKPVYRSKSDILPYMTKRWAELGIPAKVKAVSDEFNIHTNREMTRLRESGTAAEKAKQKKAYAAFQGVQIPAFFRIVGEMFHLKGWKDVGLGKKTGGNQWEGKATDIIVLKPLNGAGQVQQYDALSSAGYPEAKPMFGQLPSFNPERTWVEPPAVGGTPEPPPPPPPLPPLPDPNHPADSLDKLRAQVEAMNQAILHNFEVMSIRFDQLARRVEVLEGPYSVTLRTAHGTYVKAEDRNHEINASATSPGPWEVFTLDRQKSE